MVLSNAERQARYRANRSTQVRLANCEYMKCWFRKARKERRVSNSGKVYESHPEFRNYKDNPQRIAWYAERLFKGEGQAERRAELASKGIRPNISRYKKILEQEHVCAEPCYFFGHTETWVDIEPVAYKFHFVNGDFEKNPKKQNCWLFRRYLVRERRLDFPEVEPVFKCEKCKQSQTFQHVEDMFTFQHTCPTTHIHVDFVKRKAYRGYDWTVFSVKIQSLKQLETIPQGFFISGCYLRFHKLQNDNEYCASCDSTIDDYWAERFISGGEESE